jgi:hypothetical protein
VHALPEPRLDEVQRRRTTSGRLQMLLIALACAAPVLASYFAFYVVRPQARTNYGTLIEPTRSLPALAARTPPGAAVDLRSLRGQWLLVSVGSSACDAACERRLYTQRQLREMLGAERERVDAVWLVAEDAPLSAPLRQALAERRIAALHVERAALARWLAPDGGRALEDHLYLVDPMGEWMMRLPADPDPARVKRDLERLLRASASWDRPGR